MNKTELTFHILVNKIAGNGHAQKVFNQVTRLLTKHKYLFDFQNSNYAGALITLAREYGDQHHNKNEILLLIGGDGSLNEVLNGIKRSQNPATPFAYLPAGTGNDFGRAAKLTTDPEVLLKNLQHHLYPVSIDCGCAKLISHPDSNYYFANSFGTGFDACVIHYSNKSVLKKILNKLSMGKLIYASKILQSLRRQDTFKVTAQAESKILQYDDAFLVTTTNHPYLGGGIPLFPRANVTSHQLDTIIIEKFSIPKLLKLLFNLLKDGSHIYDPQFHYIEAEKITVATDKKEFVQIDGEDVQLDNFTVEFNIKQFNLFK
ncbi:YegS/Rv2252/BmrU family lipid kinase [Lactobacillus sp. ESL0791]|uniref:diacylglycerol/lipid kinase family protein n=1 Tax=Lactobacillus sp. ESL0791 TaxID=2983234 RepID=UPI0023F8CCD5|nr:YegS/Rv2252/BmrU family lipid kinase [Lactobacillus sp. ESL0791]MDF7638830.1 YegS/Rv2252/BmrU family lipid kinase [Lactobacillus sp. ESL0791]